MRKIHKYPNLLKKSSRDFFWVFGYFFTRFCVQIVFPALVNYVRFFPVWGKNTQIPGVFRQLCSLPNYRSTQVSMLLNKSKNINIALFTMDDKRTQKIQFAAYIRLMSVCLSVTTRIKF